MLPETLICLCGEKLSGTNLELFKAGWRLYKNQAVCPECSRKIDEAHRREAVRKCGKEAVDRADEIVEKLYA